MKKRIAEYLRRLAAWFDPLPIPTPHKVRVFFEDGPLAGQTHDTDTARLGRFAAVNTALSGGPFEPPIIQTETYVYAERTSYADGRPIYIVARHNAPPTPFSPEQRI